MGYVENVTRGAALIQLLTAAGFVAQLTPEHDVLVTAPHHVLTRIYLGAEVDGYKISTTLAGPVFDPHARPTRIGDQQQGEVLLWSCFLAAAVRDAWDQAAQHELVEVVEGVEVLHPTRPRQATVAGQYAFNLADLVARGEVKVVRASSDAFGLELTWGEVDKVTWQSWARPAAEDRGCVAAWDRCTGDPVLIQANRAPLITLWGIACRMQPLPEVLDLRGIPSSHGLISESWRDPLTVAIRASKSGVVLIVDDPPDWLARAIGV